MIIFIYAVFPILLLITLTFVLTDSTSAEVQNRDSINSILSVIDSSKESNTKRNTISKIINTKSEFTSLISNKISLPPQNFAYSESNSSNENSDSVYTTQSTTPFNPFMYGIALSTAPSISYFHYNEFIDLGGVIQSFKERYHKTPEIDGKPHSTEYGISPGLSFRFTKFFPHTGIMLRPQCSLIFGLFNTYNGSTQGEPIVNSHNDTTGFKYEPIDGTKRNIFTNAEFDFGYCFKFPLALYGGLRFNFWNRDLFSDAYISNYENYYRLSIPIGAILYIPIGSQWIIGLETFLDCMFYGSMQAKLEARGLINAIKYDFPLVHLGNKIGYQIELTAGKKVNKYLFIQFSPYLSVYGFGKSNTDSVTISDYYYNYLQKSAFYEPKSVTYWIGFNVFFNFLLSPLKNPHPISITSGREMR